MNEKIIKRDWVIIGCIYITISTPRWYLYGPFSLFRGLIICLIFFFITQIGDKVIKTLIGKSQ